MVHLKERELILIPNQTQVNTIIEKAKNDNFYKILGQPIDAVKSMLITPPPSPHTGRNKRPRQLGDDVRSMLKEGKLRQTDTPNQLSLEQVNGFNPIGKVVNYFTEDGKKAFKDMVTRGGKHFQKVTIRDSAIFIVLTFIISTIALIITKFLIYRGYITTSNQCVNIYLILYIYIFTVILILSKPLFYYINTESEDGKGVLRIILQILCILSIFIFHNLRLLKEEPSKSKNLYTLVDKLSLSTWILSSIVAMSF